MRTARRAVPTLFAICAIGFGVFASLGCEQIDGRNRTRQGNRLFRETKFVDAVAEYEKALTTVPDPIIHYNAGLAYSKVFKPGVEKPVRLGLKGSFVCEVIPNTKSETAQVCVKDGDRRYDDCDDKNVCASSYTCQKVDLCTLEQQQAAAAAAEHFQKWLAANGKDDDTRKLMTQVWLDSENYKLAIDYWTSLLKDRPNDTEIMGSLAGINLKAGDWRTSIDWYIKVADASKEDADKVAALQFIGNVAWSKLNSKTLTGPEQIELADKGIGALAKAAEIAPKNPKLWGLQGSIYYFRGLTHGESFAGSIERATAQDLQRKSRVLAEEAKKAEDAAAASGAAPTTPAPAAQAGG